MAHFKSAFFLLLGMAALQNVSSQKLWEMEQRPGGNPNNKTFTSGKNSVEFYAWGKRNGRPGNPVLSVHGRPFTFKGKCASQIKLKGPYGSFYKPRPGYPNDTPDLSRFKETRNGKDLLLEDKLAPYVKGFLDQCDELKDILIELQVAVVGERNYITYRGYLNKDTNWKLTDGQPAPREDYVANLRAGPMLGSRDQLSISYSGPCKEEMSVVIAPVDGKLPRKTGFSTNQYATFFSFERVARPFIEVTRNECLNVRQINFLLAYDPDAYYCPKGEVCQLTASEANNWTLERQGFKFDDPDLMTNYGDVIKFLEAGDFASFENYTKYFKLFFTDYMELYSEFCRANIKDPVKLELYTFEQRYDENGFLIAEEQRGPPAQMYIDKAHAKRFNSFFRQNVLTQFNNIMLGYFNASKSVNMNPLVRAILSQESDRKYIKSFLEQGCNSERSKKLYENIIVLSTKI
ncbi:MAG: hypothetical protein AAGF96_06635 [Bacteroidota bacterium]